MKDPLPWPDKPASWQEKTGGYAKDMTLRDYFAAKAMQGFCSLPADFENDRESFEMTARIAYEQADAMLKARGA